MSKKSGNPNTPIVTNTTTIGNVTGQVHTGSGDIHVSNFTASSIISSKEEFFSALHAIKAELETARQQGLSDDSVDQAKIEIESASQEAAKENPKTEGIVNHLEKAKAVLVAGTGVVTAATTTITATGKLIPFLETVIKYVSQIFS